MTDSISHCLLGTAIGMNAKLRHASPNMYAHDHTADTANSGKTKTKSEIGKESYKRMLDGTIRIGSVRVRTGEVEIKCGSNKIGCLREQIGRINLQRITKTISIYKFAHLLRE